MTNILQKPFTDIQRADFIIEYNHNNGLKIEETEMALYALQEYEVIENDKIIDISQTPEYIAEQEHLEQERKAQRKITKRQMLFWLYLNKQKTESDILNAINAIPDETQKYLAGVSYNGTNDFYYGNEFVPIIGLALGLAVQDLDKMFDEAVEL